MASLSRQGRRQSTYCNGRVRLSSKIEDKVLHAVASPADGGYYRPGSTWKFGKI
jgi:hypothetical protein